MSVTYQWPDLRTHAINQFGGQTPGAQLEQDIIDVFEQHPQVVAQAIDRIATRYHTGTIQSPWAVLRADLQRRTTSPNVQATDTTDRDHAVLRAEQWIRSSGCHFDRPSEIEHELFGDSRIHPTVDKTGEMLTSSTDGLLTPWAHDLALRQRILDLWRTERPRGEQADTAMEARASKYRDDQQAAREAKRAAITELDHAQTHYPTLPPPSPPDHDDRSPEPEPEPDVFATQGGHTA